MRSYVMLAFTALVLTAACGELATPADRHANPEEGAAPDAEQGFAMTVRRDHAPPPTAPVPKGRAQILEGTVRLRVGSVDSAVAQISELAEHLGGHMGNRVVRYGEDRSRGGSVQLRVPSERFNEAVTSLALVGRLEHSAVNATEVGEQLIDLGARLENARRLERRLLDLLRTRTGNLADVLAVERELARVREEIERSDAHLRTLGDRVASSTITVELFVPGPIVAFTPARSVLGESFRQAWRNFVELLAGFIAASGFFLPFMVVALAAFAAVRGWYRRGSRRRAPPSVAGGEATAGGILGD